MVEEALKDVCAHFAESLGWTDIEGNPCAHAEDRMSSPPAGIGRFDMAAGAADTGNPAKGNIAAEVARATANSRR